MAALTQDRNTVEREPARRNFPVKAGVVIFAGALVAIDSSGRLQPGRTDATLRGIGRSPRRIDNSTGADGDARGDAECGVFRFVNSAGADAIGYGDIGNAAYMVDDQTVAKTSATNTRSAAGVIRDVDSDGVWVEI